MLWRLFTSREARRKNQHLSFEAARELFTQWVESGKPHFNRRRKFKWWQMGFRFTGKGNNARVYLSPCKRFALRITKKGRRELGYSRFLQLALTRQDNPYYPRIYAHIQVGATQVVLMEALSPWGYCSEQAYEQARSFLRIIEGAEPLTPFPPAPYAQLVQDMQQLIAQDGISNDLYMGNLMCRKADDGVEHLVVTDPVW